MILGLNKAQRGLGGIKRMFIADYYSAMSIITHVDLDYLEIEINGDNFGFFKEYGIGRGTSSIVTNINIDYINDVTTYESTISLKFPKMDPSRSVAIRDLINRPLCVIIEDYNGYEYMFGLDSPIYARAGSINSGKAFGDFNGYELTLNAKEKNPPLMCMIV